MTDYSIVRDYWGRPYVSTDGPLVFEQGRKGPVNGEAYTRISTMAGALDDKGGLVDWAAAMAMIGVVKSKSIYAQVSHLASAHESPWYVPAAKKPLKELVEKAKDLGGASDAAGLGTAFHGLAEELDKGHPPQFVPSELGPWIAARQAALEDFEPVLIEPFVVCDQLKVAGNPDRFLRHKHTGIVYAADDKTGTDEPKYPLKVTIQVAIASRSCLYDQPTGERTPIECDTSRGLLIHTPIRGEVPQCSLYWLDLDKGWELAQLASVVRDSKKIAKLERVADAHFK